MSLDSLLLWGTGFLAGVTFALIYVVRDMIKRSR